MNENGNIAPKSRRARMGRTAELAIGEADRDLTTIGNAIGAAVAADLGAPDMTVAGCRVPAGIWTIIRDQAAVIAGFARERWGDEWRAALVAQLDAETRDE